jgi:hypothetical protein
MVQAGLRLHGFLLLLPCTPNYPFTLLRTSVPYSSLSKGLIQSASTAFEASPDKGEGRVLHFVYLEQTRVFQAGVSPLNLNSMGQTSFDRMALLLDSVWLPARPGLNGRFAVSRPSVAGGA